MPQTQHFSRAGLLLLSGLLCACEQDISVDLEGSSLPEADAITVRLDRVELQKVDDSVTELELLDAARGDIEISTLQGNQVLQLVSASDDFEGEYTGIKLVFDENDDDEVGEVRRGEETLPLRLVSDPVFTDIPFTVDQDELDSANIAVQLVMPFSATETQDDDGDYFAFRPVLRAALYDESGDVRGTIPTALIDTDSCRDGREVGEGVGVYIFEGSNRDALDYLNGGSGNPITVVPVTASTNNWEYLIAALQPGNYTVALTCDADEENPSVDDNLFFVQSHNVTVREDEESLRHFEEDD